MAECSYARCLQERRLIKRELMKWSKDMLNIVGLERVAEELMGRRKWKHYQEALSTRTNLSTDQLLASIEQLNIEEQKSDEHDDPFKLDRNISNGSKIEQQQQQKQEEQQQQNRPQQTYEENHRQQEEKNGEKQQQQRGNNHHHNQENEDDFTVKLKIDKVLKAELLTEKAENHITSHSNSPINNTNNINNNNNNNTTTTTTTPESSLKSESHITNDAVTTTVKAPDYEEDDPPTTEPIDWKPNDKCYFCVDGKLLTVNAKGELVAESGPAASSSSEVDHVQRLDSDSDSNESSTLASVGGGAGSLTDSNRINVNKLLTSHLRDLPGNMTSMDSMAARLAAIQTISEQIYPNFNWLQLAQQQQQQQQQTNSVTPTTSDTSAAAVSPSLKDSPSPSDATGEQPLDLSSKPSPNSSISGDLKSVRTKSSRATPIPTARRTYSDEDLNNALQDILSGKLGTRKAAVQYSVPRSTLRNKVYKLTLEAKRGSAQTPAELLQLQQELELASGDEGDDSSASTPQPQDVQHQQQPSLEELASRIAASATMRKMCENNVGGRELGGSSATNDSPKLNSADISKRHSGTPLSSSVAGHPLPQSSPQPQPAPLWIDSNVLLQTLLMGALQPKLDETVTLRDLFSAILLNSGTNLKDTLAAATASADATSPLNNGKPNMIDQRILLQQLQQQQQQQAPQFTHRLPKSETPETTSSLDANEACDDPSTILKIPSYKPVAGTSSSSMGGAHSSNSPALLCSASSSNNINSGNSNNNPNINCNPNRDGDSPHSPHISTSMLAAAVAAAANAGGNNNSASNRHINNSNLSVISPPLLHHHHQHQQHHQHNLSRTADSQSPTSLTLRDVMANSIHRTMNELANKDAAHAAAAASMLGLGSGGGTSDSERNSSLGAGPDYKKPSISVVKNIGGTDTARFGAAPNLLAAVSGATVGGGGAHSTHHHHQPHPAHLQHAAVAAHHAHHHHHHHTSHHLSRQEAAALAAGKGTRPKRGKYRNYDRDSLVEAVKAVQRGEMSVHRAGSYYGVPHSTLEYKVKERHLMRPRKREPKPQPGLDGSSTTAASKVNSASNIPGLQNSLDKMKAGASGGGNNSKLGGAAKGNNATAAFPQTAAANGMKLPMFDPSVAAQLQYPPHIFWQHSPAAAFGQLQIDFNRNAAAAAAQGGNASSVNADLIKSRIQRYQEETLRAGGTTNSNQQPANSPSPIASPMSGPPHAAALNIKSARELAENLYESSGAANGAASFLDGIIRQTLDRKSERDVVPAAANTSGGALLDQLLVKKTPLPFTNNRSNEYAAASSSASVTAATMATATKRSASPLSYADIKRERTSPGPAHSSGDGSDSDDDDASQSGGEEMLEHNNNSSKHNLLSGNGGLNMLATAEQYHHHQQQQHHQLQQRSRITSQDSETDASSIKSERRLQHATTHQNHNSSKKITDLNGGVGVLESSIAVCGGSGSNTSILHEKLAQIKAEQEREENL